MTEKKTDSQKSCCCTPAWVIGNIETPVGKIQQVSTVLSTQDTWSWIRARSGSFRNGYRVAPGLYGVGVPDTSSPVLVTANYKLTFDMLRREIGGINAWILVLDTRGINVWCAAGKGTFGTAEIVRKIKAVKLNEIVDHQNIILPQLGAPGVQAHIVKRETGFRVLFGPIYAKDIRAYLAADNTASPEMRRVRFNMKDRLELIPIEIGGAFKKLWWWGLILLAIFGLQPQGIFFDSLLVNGMPILGEGITALFAGAFLTPLLLPFIPFRSFAIKGWIVGLLCLLPFVSISAVVNLERWFYYGFAFFLFPALSSYLALLFTGSTTFTSPSGVDREVKRAIPFYIICASLAVICLIGFKLSEWGII
jgi:hypothetical protein